MHIVRSACALFTIAYSIECTAAPPPARAPSPARAAPAAAKASSAPERADAPITAAQRAETIDRLLALLGEKYVFPDKAKLAQEAVAARRRRGEYDSITTGKAFAAALTRDVNAVLKDAHFGVGYSRPKIPENELSGPPTREEEERHAAEGRRNNGGFERVERLPGNIGYLEVRSFSYLERGSEAAAAAMGFLADTEALILDLRRNGGGEPDMVAALCSYFFAKPVHLNDLYFRPNNETRQFWTSAGVPSRRYLDRDVYVLTSKLTGSGAEEFAYNLKVLKRATLIGESTWGGANPGDVLRLSDHFSAFIPTGRAINPITKTNWEGVGVKPDISVPAADALRVAQVKALEKRLAVVTDRALREALERRLRELAGG